MKVAFRADASIQIGNGHVMRCLTLADGLQAAGGNCLFICRLHVGHLVDMIEARGYKVVVLPPPGVPELNSERIEHVELPVHANWLGTDWLSDAEQTREALDGERQIDWLVVDHYALDIRWEQALGKKYKYLMVIDDLADRSHDCDLLLDQNLGRKAGDYIPLVPKGSLILTGPRFAILRPEFSKFRPMSLSRRSAPQLKHILISMGGVDKDNATGAILSALNADDLPVDCRITVVMGESAPWLRSVQSQAECLPWKTEVMVSVRDIARLMTEADLAIGAAGSTSWERCCLGIPTIMVICAENQRAGALALSAAGAAVLIGDIVDIPSCLGKSIREARLSLRELSFKSSQIVLGDGMKNVMKHMGSVSAN